MQGAGHLQQLAEHGLQINAAVQHELRVDNFKRKHRVDVDTGIVTRDDVETREVKHCVLYEHARQVAALHQLDRETLLRRL